MKIKVLLTRSVIIVFILASLAGCKLQENRYEKKYTLDEKSDLKNYVLTITNENDTIWHSNEATRMHLDFTIDGIRQIFLNGKLVEESLIIEGKRNGYLILYDEKSGKVKTEGHYRDGLKNGIWNYYDDNLLLYKKELFINGVLHR